MRRPAKLKIAPLKTLRAKLRCTSLFGIAIATS
jgi:hypothetical protein